jgi:small glutamine-rich tetratricopeptide repeat-containing protein alpha
MNRGYQTALKKYREQNPEAPAGTREAPASNSPAPAAGGGMPDFASLLGALGGGAGSGGGAPDFSSILNNPALMQAAQQMAGSGAFNDIMSNPRMREMAQQMMSGERNFTDMLSDPDVQNLYDPS